MASSVGGGQLWPAVEAGRTGEAGIVPAEVEPGKSGTPPAWAQKSLAEGQPGRLGTSPGAEVVTGSCQQGGRQMELKSSESALVAG